MTLCRVLLASFLMAVPMSLAAQAQAQAGIASSTRSINVGDALLRVESTGRGRAVVLIHGWAQDLGIWDDQVAALSSRYRVIRYDLRGFGESTGYADETIDPDDLRILLDSLGLRTATILGLSKGADAALNFAVAFPDRVDQLVLYGVGPPPGFQPMPPDLPNIVAMFGPLARQHGLDTVGKLVYASPVAWAPPGKPEVAARMRAFWPRYKGRDLLDPKPESGRVPRARLEQLGRIRAPTLVLNGDHDMPFLLVVADTLTQRIPNARRIVIQDGGHGAHFAQPAAFNNAILEFLARRP